MFRNLLHLAEHWNIWFIQAYEIEVGDVGEMQPSSRWEKDTETYVKQIVL